MLACSATAGSATFYVCNSANNSMLAAYVNRLTWGWQPAIMR
jgi:hypothetical protein